MDPDITMADPFEADASTTTTSWKRVPSANGPAVKYVPLSQARQFFAIDASGSAMGRPIQVERSFAESLHRNHSGDTLALWGSRCNPPTDDWDKFNWNKCLGGTYPNTILTTALESIRNSDVWHLLTDGEVGDSDVQLLSAEATRSGILNVPVIFTIVGYRSSLPGQTNISVGITFFANASDVLILFKDISDESMYLVAAKGCFASLAGDMAAIPQLDSWENLKKFRDNDHLVKDIERSGIHVPRASDRPQQVLGIRLGPQWESHPGNKDAVVDLEALLNTNTIPEDDLEQLLAEDAFNNLVVATKTRGGKQTQRMRTWLTSKKTETMVLKLEDVSGAGYIISQLGGEQMDETSRAALQMQLREAHAKNREHYQQRLRELDSPENTALRRRNVLINQALETLAEIEQAGYSAEILSRRSNRARRAETIQATAAEVAITRLDLEATGALRGECPICCGDNEVMSIALKTGADGAANTDNFALDFPLAVGAWQANVDVVASQVICFQCALLARPGKTMYGEPVTGILPTLPYDGDNKKYMQEVMYLALTNGLKTGASVLAQLFMAVLDQILRTKEWAGAGMTDAGDLEVEQRRRILQWTLDELLSKSYCRETFNEQGEWVPYPKALAWAARDFREQNLTSWAVQYPVAGFMELISLGRRSGAFDDSTIQDLRGVKVLHSTVSAHLANLLKQSDGDETWKQQAYRLIYSEFNTAMIPRDLGPQSVVSDVAEFWTRLRAFLSADERLLDDWNANDQARIMHRIQFLLFWLIHRQKGHTTAKTFFAQLAGRESLAPAILNINADLASTVIHPILLSIFRPPNDTPLYALHNWELAPFATPFGPSVLHCAFPRCQASFLTFLPEDTDLNQVVWTADRVEALRALRAQHLIDAFGIPATPGYESFRKGQTGMPEVTQTPKPPVCAHLNIHMGIARTWSHASLQERQAVVEGRPEAFVRKVRDSVCRERRGDVFHADLDKFVKGILPSFLDMLKKGLALDGMRGESVLKYEHDWNKKGLADKIEWEILAMGVQF